MSPIPESEDRVQGELLIDETVDAVASDDFGVLLNRPVTVQLFSSVGLTAGEYIDLQMSHDGVLWHDVFIDGNQVRMDANNNSITIYGPGLYRVNKALTTNVTGVMTYYA